MNAPAAAAGAAGGLLLAAGLALRSFAARCPACAHVRGFFGEYCRYCGEKLDWDEPPRF